MKNAKKALDELMWRAERFQNPMSAVDRGLAAIVIKDLTERLERAERTIAHLCPDKSSDA